jgi:hypothetical protein
MTYKFSEGFPSPLVWTIKAGYYDANLVATEFATAPRYTTDATIFPVTMNSSLGPEVDTWFMIFGYTLDNGTLMPVFPGQYGIEKNLKISMGRFYNYPWIHMGYWANEQRTEYVEKKVYNYPYVEWSTTYEINSPYQLPQPDWSHMHLNTIYPVYHEGDMIMYKARPESEYPFPIYGYYIDPSNKAFPVFVSNTPTLTQADKTAYVAIFGTDTIYYPQPIGVGRNFTIASCTLSPM